MEYQGRSPLKDVARSVVMGAAMIPAAVLASCGGAQQGPTASGPVTTPPGGTDGDAGASTEAPPPEVVRPRNDPRTPQMPTRGFAGSARARR